MFFILIIYLLNSALGSLYAISDCKITANFPNKQKNKDFSSIK
jgi:hypothetical protein